MKTCWILILCLAFPACAWGETHYVSNTGSATWANSTDIAQPCSLDTANTNAAAGDVVVIRGGTYSPTSDAINPTNNGTCNPPGTPEANSCKIIYQAYTGETPLFTSTVTVDRTAINLDAKKYIKVTGLTFQDFGRWAVLDDASNHNEISYCEMYNTALGGPFSGTTYAPYPLTVYILNGSTHNWIHHNTFHNEGRGGMDE